MVGGGPSISLGVFDLDRLSSLTVCRREIGKVNVEKTLGKSMKMGRVSRVKTTHSFPISRRLEESLRRSPSSSIFPPKPDYIARDRVASDEWDRICGELRKLPFLVEAGEDPIANGALYYSAIQEFRTALDAQGRGADTQPMANDCDRMVWRYLTCLREELLGITPGPLARIRLV